MCVVVRCARMHVHRPGLHWLIESVVGGQQKHAAPSRLNGRAVSVTSANNINHISSFQSISNVER